MKVLILWADQRSSNLGVRALAEGSGALVRRVWPDATTSFQSYGPGDAPMRVGDPKSLVREWATNRQGLMRLAEELRSRLVDTRSGDSFADIYGLPSAHDNVAAARVRPAGRGAGRRSRPQTIGPFDSARARTRSARRTLRRATAVFARDPSARGRRPVGPAGRRVASDLVFGIDQSRSCVSVSTCCSTSPVCCGRSDAHVDSTAYRATVAGIIDGLLGEWSDGDAPPARARLGQRRQRRAGHSRARRRVRRRRRDRAPAGDLDDARSTDRGRRLVIGARMHACLNALSTGTPAIAMAYSRKFAPLMGDRVDDEHRPAKRSPCRTARDRGSRRRVAHQGGSTRRRASARTPRAG